MGEATLRATVALLPVGPGVYRFRDEGGCPLYVGRAANLRARVSSYWGPLGDRPWLARMVPRIAEIEAVVCSSVHEATWLERNLLERRRPTWNRAIGGQEVPVSIRLDPRPSSPGLTVVHDPQPSDAARHFGPYLGGAKVRLAVSGLRRLLPVEYAADALGGSGRDMARVLGVDQRDRDALIRSLGAVLDRDPVEVAWVRSELRRRREEAVQAQAFERAARLQAEAMAIEWVVAEQKVAMLEARDMEVHGWAKGVLVSFEVRAGRLCGWRYRRCPEAGVRRHVETTPTAYADFASVNALLAARLLDC